MPIALNDDAALRARILGNGNPSSSADSGDGLENAVRKAIGEPTIGPRDDGSRHRMPQAWVDRLERIRQNDANTPATAPSADSNLAPPRGDRRALRHTLMQAIANHTPKDAPR